MKKPRRVWIFTTGDATAEERPLAVLLGDGFWVQSMPVWPMLASLTHRQQLPLAVYVLIDAIDTTYRAHELPCSTGFWLAVQQELLPLVRAITPFSDRIDHTVVAGQSFGGLSVLYAGLHWPERFGCVLSQSGSYWWPHRGGQQKDVLLERLKAGEVNAEDLHIVLKAGIREPMITRANQALCTQLHSIRESIFWRQIDGGHDTLCWRGGLTQGLIDLWQPLFHDRN